MNCCCFDGRTAGAALGRWALGLLFLVAGAAKFAGGVGGFVNGYLVPAFSKTFLPTWLLQGYGYALPTVETVLGVLLLLGICRNCTLLVTGLTLISLAFGQLLLQQATTIMAIFIYIGLDVLLLSLDEHDTWRLFRKPAEADKKSCGCSCC